MASFTFDRPDTRWVGKSSQEPQSNKNTTIEGKIIEECIFVIMAQAQESKAWH